MEQQEAAEWCSRCAQRLGELDDSILAAEARDMAKDLYAFERTRAMDPRRAAEFVTAEMANSERKPFERRSVERKPFERRAVDRRTAPPSVAPRRADPG